MGEVAGVGEGDTGSGAPENPCLCWARTVPPTCVVPFDLWGFEPFPGWGDSALLGATDR